MRSLLSLSLAIATLSFIFLTITDVARAQDAPSTGTLKRVVILSRHGVRSPTQSAETLKTWQRETTPPPPPWPDFGVPPGYLTPKGEELVEKMGQYYRSYLDKNGLFDPAQCPDQILIWADRDERTLMTAQGLGTGLTRTNSKRDCHFAVYESAEKIDAVFHPTEAIQECHLDPGKVKQCIDNPKDCIDIDGLKTKYRQQLGQAQSILDCCSTKLCPPAREGAHDVACSLQTLPSDVDTTKGQASIQGGLGIGQSFAEILLLEYAQGFSGANFGFGRADKAKMLEILQLHTGVFDAAQRFHYVAERQGADLLYHLAYAIATGRDPGVTGDENKLIVYVGHDTNIANVAELLDLHWSLPGYPQDDKDDMPPGGALIFEVRQVANQEPSVYAFFASQSPDALRGAPPKAPVTLQPSMVTLSIPQCSGPTKPCSVKGFVGLAKQALKYNENKDCVTDWQWSSRPQH